MTIEAERNFLGMPLGKKIAESGSIYRFVIEESFAGKIFPVGIHLQIISSNAIRIVFDRSSLYETLAPTSRESRVSQTVREKKDIDGTFIPSKIPGLKQVLKWTPSR